MTAAPEWQAYTMPDYDATMTRACAAVHQRILDDAAYRSELLTDPRPLHRALFAEFAPPNFPEYAGTFRGAEGTSLQGRRSGAPQLFSPAKSFSFDEPENVAAGLDYLLSDIRRELAPAKSAPPYAQLLTLTHLFCWFGKIHPFLDGNGHIQRALFAAAATELGIPLAARFAIHPRPFDSLLAWPLEMFTRAAPEQRERFLGMVAEYLSSWLAGPFDLPASGIAP
jgi:fido (protein-threonine AMPylation protein)